MPQRKSPSKLPVRREPPTGLRTVPARMAARPRRSLVAQASPRRRLLMSWTLRCRTTLVEERRMAHPQTALLSQSLQQTAATLVWLMRFCKEDDYLYRQDWRSCGSDSTRSLPPEQGHHRACGAFPSNTTMIAFSKTVLWRLLFNRIAVYAVLELSD